MGVLGSILEGLRETDVCLEQYGRSGRVAASLGSRELLARVQATRGSFREPAMVQAGQMVQTEQRGERRVVGLLFRPDETIEFLIATLAAMAERWTVVPLYPNWSPETQLEYIETYRLRVLFSGRSSASRVASWAEDGSTGVAHAFELTLEGEPAPLVDGPLRLLDDIPTGHPCAWIFTSGTSSRLAKLTEITVGNIEAAAKNIEAIDFVYPGMTLHNPLSASHIFAFAVILGLLAVKPRRVLFSDVQYLGRLDEERTGKLDGMILVPIVLNRMRATFYEKIVARIDRKRAPAAMRRLARIPMPLRVRLKRIVQRAEDALLELESGRRIGLRHRASIAIARRVFGAMIRRRLGSPEFVVIGGAKPNLRSMAFFEVMGVRCLQGWGMTETTGPLAVCRLDDRFGGAFGTCGPVFPDCKAYVEDGELIVEGPQIARGYLTPEGDFVAFEGKTRTGDFAEFDEAGRLRVIGKASDRITTENGLNHNPIPFEEGLQALDLESRHLLDEVVVVGDAQPRLGAVFYLREGRSEDEEVRGYVASLLAEFNGSRAVEERIDAWVVDPDDFRAAGVLGPSGKLIRRLVEARHAGMFDRWKVEVS